MRWNKQYSTFGLMSIKFGIIIPKIIIKRISSSTSPNLQDSEVSTVLCGGKEKNHQ